MCDKHHSYSETAIPHALSVIALRIDILIVFNEAVQPVIGCGHIYFTTRIHHLSIFKDALLCVSAFCVHISSGSLLVLCTSKLGQDASFDLIMH